MEFSKRICCNYSGHLLPTLMLLSGDLSPLFLHHKPCQGARLAGVFHGSFCLVENTILRHNHQYNTHIPKENNL